MSWAATLALCGIGAFGLCGGAFFAVCAYGTWTDIQQERRR